MTKIKKAVTEVNKMPFIGLSVHWTQQRKKISERKGMLIETDIANF